MRDITVNKQLVDDVAEKTGLKAATIHDLLTSGWSFVQPLYPAAPPRWEAPPDIARRLHDRQR